MLITEKEAASKAAQDTSSPQSDPWVRMPPVKSADRLGAERIALLRERGERIPVSELEIFSVMPDRIKVRTEDPIRALFICGLRQAWVDASWRDPWEGQPLKNFGPYHPSSHKRLRNRIERIVAREDKIFFFAGAIDPSDDCDDVGFGDAEELLTLDFICREILDWNPEIIRAEACRRLRARGPVHSMLLEEYLAIAAEQRGQSAKKVPRRK